MNWELLLDEATFRLRRSGRFLVTDLQGEHKVLSTSFRHGGQVTHVRHLLNHQSCEGAGHAARHQLIADVGQDAYHDRACADAGLPSASTAMMGTAANMNYAAVSRELDGALAVTAAVTAGVEGNATTAGESANWRETPTGINAVSVYAGTINIVLLISHPLTPAALARCVVTMTEGKSAALQRLSVPSKRGLDLATGTGTDQYCIAAPSAGPFVLTSASPHVKLGELVGRAVRDATLEALRWQNGLEASYTRGVFHALGRFGVCEATIIDDLAPWLGTADLELIRKNIKAAFYEPLVGAAAHALAAVADRVRHGTLPTAVTAEALAQQAACLAASLAGQVHRWPEFCSALREVSSVDVKTLVLRAIAIGWAEKWRTS
jgi:adenosylcobinamide amidohydrolase